MMHQPARDPRPRKLDPTLLLAFLLPVFAWAPLTYPGYFVFRSGFLPVFNLADRLAPLADPAWAPAVGKSYSLLGGEGGLPYLLAVLPAALGASPSNAVKWILALAFIAGSAGAYSWTRRRLGDGWPALVAASLYVLSPIWLPAVYTRGALAEAVLLGLLPWMLWAADAAATGRRAAGVILALLSAACLWTQAWLGFAFLVTVLVYLLVLHQTKRISWRGFSLAGLGLLGGVVLAALGLVPAIASEGPGATEPPQVWQLMVLLAPWLALLVGWIASRLAAMLGEPEQGEKPALFAALIGLILLGVYADIQPVVYAGPIPSAPLAIYGENEIALLSVKTEGTPGPGGRVALDVEWQALRPLTRDYTVFFHITGSNGQRYGQVDTMPQAGKLPTTRWQPGEVVRDRYEAMVSQDAPVESDYRYWLGWYLGETGQRLPVGQDDKYVVKP
ncbi:MAG: 6-pyruvoyl-tetrahydropterin synthase-related protein [Nitrososphaerales archaeon]